MHSLFGVYPVDPSHVIASVLVAYFAFHRFDTPPTARGHSACRSLIMTTLLPAFPGLREVDARILCLFHKIGAIPFGAVRWTGRSQLSAGIFRDHSPLPSV